MKVLIAEDDFTSRTMLKGILSKWGYLVTVAEDGNEAWKVLQTEGAPRLLILDWMMPGMNGPALCRKLRQQEHLQPLYIILLTSRGDHPDIIKGLESGADDYIAKPYNQEELRVRLQVGARCVGTEVKLRHYAANMEKLAEERARQLMHADRLTTIGILSAGVAHEINNPLSFIAVNIQTLEENWTVIAECIDGSASDESKLQAKLIGSEMAGMLKDMRNGVSRIKEIVNGLKTYARAEGKKQEAVLINTCIDNALRLCANQLKHRIQVKTDLAEELPPLTGDENRLVQVFVNLFVNAADAIESSANRDGSLFITTVSENKKILTIVRDTGPGIPNGNYEKLFKPFFTTKAVGKGTGLGLSISRNIIEDHGGTITVRNHSDGGAEFRITLPVASATF